MLTEKKNVQRSPILCENALSPKMVSQVPMIQHLNYPSLPHNWPNMMWKHVIYKISQDIREIRQLIQETRRFGLQFIYPNDFWLAYKCR